MAIKNINKYLESSDLIEKLRSDFAKTQKDAVANILKAINDGDRETAHRLAHSLKGLAGLICENSLMHAAKTVETSLSLYGATNEELVILETELNRVISSIVPKEKVVNLAPKVLNKAAAKATFDKALPLLASRNADALQLIDELCEIPGTDEIVDLIEGFDFGPALNAINALRETLDV